MCETPIADAAARHPYHPELLENNSARRYLDGGSPVHGSSTNHDGRASQLRSNHACRCLVDAAASHLSRPGCLHRLFDLGRISGEPLLFRSISFAVLFAGTFWIIAA